MMGYLNRLVQRSVSQGQDTLSPDPVSDRALLVSTPQETVMASPQETATPSTSAVSSLAPSSVRAKEEPPPFKSTNLHERTDVTPQEIMPPSETSAPRPTIEPPFLTPGIPIQEESGTPEPTQAAPVSINKDMPADDHASKDFSPPSLGQDSKDTPPVSLHAEAPETKGKSDQTLEMATKPAPHLEEPATKPAPYLAEPATVATPEMKQSDPTQITTPLPPPQTLQPPEPASEPSPPLPHPTETRQLNIGTINVESDAPQTPEPQQVTVYQDAPSAERSAGAKRRYFGLGQM